MLHIYILHTIVNSSRYLHKKHSEMSGILLFIHKTVMQVEALLKVEFYFVPFNHKSGSKECSKNAIKGIMCICGYRIIRQDYLKTIGIADDRDRNQVANYTYIDYATNIDISDKPPVEYIPEYRSKLGDSQFAKTCAENALPDGFESMDYFTFLTERRKLMAEIIRKGYERLCM